MLRLLRVLRALRVSRVMRVLRVLRQTEGASVACGEPCRLCHSLNSQLPCNIDTRIISQPRTYCKERGFIMTRFSQNFYNKIFLTKKNSSSRYSQLNRIIWQKRKGTIRELFVYIAAVLVLTLNWYKLIQIISFRYGECQNVKPPSDDVFFSNYYRFIHNR